MTSDGKGFNYYQYKFDNVAPNQPIKLSASYTKTDSKPSVEKAKSGATNDLNLPLFGVFGAGLLALVAYYALSRRRAQLLPAPARQMPTSQAPARAKLPVDAGVSPQPTRPPARPAPAAGRTRAGATPSPTTPLTFFCTRCGIELVADDRFCPKCGQMARKPM